MSDPIKEGDECTVMRDIVIGGGLAFKEGEKVKVDKLDANPERAEYKYVVMSKRLNKRFQLSDKDIAPMPVPGIPPVTQPVKAEPQPVAPVDEAKATVAERFGNWKWIALIAVAFLVAAGIGVTLTLIFTGNGGEPQEDISTLQQEVQLVMEEAGTTSTALSREINSAIEREATPEGFAVQGKIIADKYIPIYRGYYNEVKAVQEKLSLLKPASELEAKRTRLLKACDSYGRAMLGYVTALDQLSRGEINEATATFGEVRALIEEGNTQLTGQQPEPEQQEQQQ